MSLEEKIDILGTQSLAEKIDAKPDHCSESGFRSEKSTITDFQRKLQDFAIKNNT